MQEITCNYCGQNDTELVNEGPDLYLNRDCNYHLVCCQHCGLIYLNPQPTKEELLFHYPTKQYQLYSQPTLNNTSSKQKIENHRGMMRRYQRIMKYFGQPGTILDVGCATGSFIAVMREQNWHVTGVELNPEAAAYARDIRNLDIHTGTLEEVNFPDNTFDVITFWDVFEHVQDPKATLTEVVRILKPKGMLVVAVPNPNSLEARLFGSNWAGWDRPRHLQLFPPQLLKQYLEDAGFEYTVFESFSGRLSVTLLSISYWLTSRNLISERWSRILSVAYNPFTRLLTWPIYQIAEAFNQTTNITAFARLP